MSHNTKTWSISLLVLVTSCSVDGGYGKGGHDHSGHDHSSDIRNEDVDQESSGPRKFVSSYPWQSFAGMQIPKSKREQEQTALALTGEKSCRIANEIVSLKNQFDAFLKRSYEKPDVKLCTGEEIEVGKTYAVKRGGRIESVFRFQHEPNADLFFFDCDKRSLKPTYAHSYHFASDAKFRTKYWSLDEGNKTRWYSSFSKFVDDPNKIFAVNVDPDQKSFSRVEFDVNGNASMNQLQVSADGRAYVSRAHVTPNLGVSTKFMRETTNTEFKKDWQSVSDQFDFETSVALLSDEDYAAAQAEVNRAIEPVDSPFWTADSAFPSGYECKSDYEVVDCGSEPANVKEASNSSGPERDICSSFNSSKPQFRYEFFEDSTGTRDRALQVEGSVAVELNRGLLAGEAIGVRVRLGYQFEGEAVDVSNSFDYEENDGFQRVKPDCTNVKAVVPSNGVARNVAEQCGILKTHPVLFMVKTVTQSKQYPIKIKKRDLSAELRLVVDVGSVTPPK